MHLQANQIQTSMTLEGFGQPKKEKGVGGCCGLFDSEDVKCPPVIDKYHCALKDGLVLIQGKLKLYENYLCFFSSFNSKTLFGYSDIRIPKWDILQITEGKHLISLKITIQTNHGNI